MSKVNCITLLKDLRSPQLVTDFVVRSKEIIRTTKSVTNWGLLRSFNSVLADWNDLSPTTKKLPLRDLKNVLRKTFK